MMIRRISYTLYILLSLTLLSSCNTMDEMLDEKQDTATLTVKIAQQDPTTVTRSVTETIRNVNILVFNAQGNLIGSTYNDSAPTSVSVPVRISSGCTICAIANTGSGTYFDGISTLTELKAKATTAVTDPTAIADIMYGEQSGVNITSSTASQDIKVKRLYSKYTFTITPPSDVTITSYQLCNVPNECYIASGNTDNPTTGFSGLNYSAVTTSVAAGAAVTAGPYYIYENLAGTNPSLNTAELRTSGNATSGASYLLINAKGSYWKSTYRIYLGGVTNTASPSIDFTNFNIYRDLNYQCSISLSSNGSKGDARVTYTAAAVGQYLYSDGTWGASASVSGKTTIGLIFSTDTELYPHGCVVALTDASSSSTWSNASSVCSSYTAGGKNGWRLPSSNELVAINTAMANANLTSSGMYKSGLYYWSSTERDTDVAYYVLFNSDGSTYVGYAYKSYDSGVRAVLAF